MTTPQNNRSRNRAIRFAEDELGIHQTFEEAVHARNNLRTVMEQRHAAEVQLRKLEDKYDEQVLASRDKLREVLGPVSATAFDSAAKDELLRNPDLKALREEMSDIRGNISYLNIEVRTYELGHRQAVARMTQVAEYLRYLASAKDAATAAKNAVNDWPWS